MKTLTIDGISITASDEIAPDEAQRYVDDLKKHYFRINSITMTADGDFVNIEIHTPNKPFERFRRITGKPDQ